MFNDKVYDFGTDTAWYIFIVLFISLVSLSCTDEKHSVGVVDPMNPNIVPNVISTYPLDGSAGPFNHLYDAAFGTDNPHFYIHFNKLMDMSTLTIQSVTCQGCAKPVKVLTTGSSYSSNDYADIIAFSIRDVPGGNYYGETYSYEVGKKYTITLDTTIKDFNGNHLRVPYTFSFIPEPKFRVMSMYPSGGDTLFNNSSDEIIHIYFNGPISKNISSALSIKPVVQGKWSTYLYSSYSEADFQPQTGFASNKSYTITISGAAGDTLGHKLGQNYSTSFFTPTFRILTPLPNSIAYLYNEIEFQFSAPIDTASARRAFTLSPNTPISIFWFANGFFVYPINDWSPETDYQYTFSTNLKDMEGNPLSSPIHQSFTTPQFRICYFLPYPDSRNVDPDKNIGIIFTGRIDTGSVRSAFHLLPSTTGHFTIYNSQIDFIKDSSFLENTTYTIKIDHTFRSIAGYHLAAPDSFSFTTGRSSPK